MAHGSLYSEWIARNASQAASSVSWQLDEAWFSERLAADVERTRGEVTGCCPAAARIYEKRPGFRCCKHKLHEILPLRPRGGATWEDVATASGLPPSLTLVLTGDSMVEQQYVALLCLAWAEPSTRYERLRTINVSLGTRSTFGWEATVVHMAWRARLLYIQSVSPIDVTQRSTAPADGSASALLAQAHHLILGGWQHAPPSIPTLRELIGNLSADWPGLRSTFVEALPSHFPGGTPAVAAVVTWWWPVIFCSHRRTMAACNSRASVPRQNTSTRSSPAPLPPTLCFPFSVV